MNRNVAIVTIILILVVAVGYLVWLRSKFQPPVTFQPSPSAEVSTEPSPSLLPSLSASASASSKSSPKAATSGAVVR